MRRATPPRSSPVLPLAPPWFTVRGGVAHHHLDPLERHVELVGDDLGDRDIDALRAVGLAEKGDGRAVLAHRDEAIELIRRERRLAAHRSAWRRPTATAGAAKRDDERARALEKIAAGNGEHVVSSSLASLTPGPRA